jgi:class 3 adenylate cyclase/tetratricopeptide (TPR) repeat protein
VVTVVFADLAESTALQERLDAESARAVMARFYQAMRAVVDAHGGRVQKFIGDAVVAVFGAPVVREDDALRAVRAAAAMTRALADLNGELERGWGVQLTIRTGVHTGELVVVPGSGARIIGGSEIVVGDVMNTAARLEQAAASGEILIGDETWRLVRQAVEVESVAALELKGKSAPVRAWRLVSPERDATSRELPVEPPLVAREAELARLRSALEETIAARTCRLATVIGSPGVGKTRLAQEFARSVGDRANVVAAHCEPSGEGITLLPVAEAVRSLAGIGEADPPEMVAEKLRALAPEVPESKRINQRVAGVLGAAEPSSAEETFWALRRGLELLARQRPIVIVVDDLHWGQPMFLDLLEHLIEWVSAAPVLILALARGELREIRESLTSTRRRATHVIELQPLGEAESRALVSGLLGGQELPEALGERILTRSEGNPLFLGEMMRMLVDEGAIRHEAQRWIAVADAAAIEVPPTINALLAARIERLGAEERSVVERAAVIGKEFYRGAVAQLVAPRVRTAIDGHLEALRRKDMVEPEGTYWIDEPVYRFHHVLIRDAAYRLLLKEARAELHERVADWLEVKAGELVGEHEEVIAFHLEQAHSYWRELGPLDARGKALGVRAAHRFHSAGRRALARADLAAAANLLGRALECDAAAEPDILWDLCETVLSAGDTENAAGLVKRLAAVGAADPRGRARASILAAQLANLTGAGEAADASDSLAEAASALGELGDRAGEAKGWHVCAQARARLGEIAAAEEALDSALRAARSAEDARRMTAVLADAPRAALWGPSPVVQASGRCLDVVRILRITPGNRHVEANGLRCQAVLEAMRGRTDAARELLADARANLEELGLTVELHEMAIDASLVELLSGDAFSAEALLRRALDGFTALGLTHGAAQAAALLARALIEQGRDEEAEEQATFAQRHASDDLKTTIAACGAQAQALASRGEHELALTTAQRAVELAAPTDALTDKADASMALACVLHAIGRDQEAREEAGYARALYEAKGHTVGVTRAERAGDASRQPVRPTPQTLLEREPSALGDKPPEQVWAASARCLNARDLDGIVGLYADAWVETDRRRLRGSVAHGREAAERLWRSAFEMNSDLRIDIEEILACDNRVIAGRFRLSGRATADAGGGRWEISAGTVMVVEHAQFVSSDRYEYDDEAAMLARYAELSAT